MQTIVFNKQQRPLAGSPRLSSEVCQLVSGARAFELQRQTVPAPLDAKLTLRVRGVDSGPVDIYYGVVHSWFGKCLIAWTADGICWLDPRPTAGSLAELEQTWLPASISCAPAAAERYARETLEAPEHNVPLHLCGTAFQLQVWSALLQIRPGCYLHYGDLAQQLGKPRAARAIGQAVGANGVSVLVPCHRVLAAGGHLGGYRWGPDLKLALLQREALAAGRTADNFT